LALLPQVAVVQYGPVRRTPATIAWFYLSVRVAAVDPFRLALPVLVSLALIVAGTLGYRLIEGWSYFDALYMTVITLTTVGYVEVHEMSQAGRSFTMLLCLGGVFTIFYAITATIRSIVSGEVHGILERRRMETRLHDLTNHLIICGFGRMGRLICQEFSAQGLPFVAIERRAELLNDVRLPHGILVHGDATSDEVLQEAGVERARALISVVASDADNLYITMSSRLLNEKLFIVARAEEHGSEQKLLRAGANRVVSPTILGGSRVAQAILRPTVVDFIELATRTEHVELQIEEIKLDARSKLVGMSLKESQLRQDFGVIIVAIKKASGQMAFNPPSSAIMEPGDILIAISNRLALDRLARVAEIPPVQP
jgi:voltage-gated potassium channel